MTSQPREIPSSTVSLHHSSALLLLLTTLIALLSSATPMSNHAASPSTSSTRWSDPCTGRSAVIHSNDASEDINIAAPETDAAHMTSTFRALSTSTRRLKRRVRHLKTLYVRHRFRDEAMAIDLDQIGLTLEGLPHIHQPTYANINEADATNVVHRAFEHLARVAVFINQARIGETLAFNEPISFEHEFERIEDHHRDGLYWLLCAVKTVVTRTARPTIDASVAEALSLMRVVAVDRNAMRHTRDYLVLRDLERLLGRLSIEFAVLGQHRSATGNLTSARLPSEEMTSDVGSADQEDERI